MKTRVSLRPGDKGTRQLHALVRIAMMALTSRRCQLSYAFCFLNIENTGLSLCGKWGNKS